MCSVERCFRALLNKDEDALDGVFQFLLQGPRKFVTFKGLFTCLRSNKIDSFKTTSWCENS